MDTNIDEALALIRTALASTEEALAASSSLEQLQERFEKVVSPLIDESELMTAVYTSQSEVKKLLFHARGCLEEMLTQMTRGHSPDAQTRAWADQFVDLNERLQTLLTQASQQATRIYESLRPTLIAHYLQYATRTPRWEETWPFDANLAKEALERIATESDFGPVDDLDIQLARFRWEVGWPQQRMATIVGLSQPAVATRLGRIEALISLEVATKHVRDHAAKEQIRLVRWNVLAGKGSRTSSGDLVLETDKYTIQLELLTVTGETGNMRRTTTGDRAASLDYLRLESADRRQLAGGQSVSGIAVYFRDRGIVGYYTTAELAEAMRRFRNLPTLTVLQYLKERVEPAWTIKGLLQRAERPDSGSTQEV